MNVKEGVECVVLIKLNVELSVGKSYMRGVVWCGVVWCGVVRATWMWQNWNTYTRAVSEDIWLI